MAPDARQDAITAAPTMALECLAQDARTELLVVGDEGGGPLRAKLGRTAGREVLSHVACPLVLVPARDAHTSPEMRAVVCGVDDNHAAPRVAAGAAGLARRLGARLHIVHVLKPPRWPRPGQLAQSWTSSDARRRSRAVFANCRAALPEDVSADS